MKTVSSDSRDYWRFIEVSSFKLLAVGSVVLLSCFQVHGDQSSPTESRKEAI